MKIAVTSLGNTSDSKMDPRFGRCAFFAIYDTVANTYNFIDNPGKNAGHGAGPQAAELIANNGVKKVVSGEFGPKAKNALESLEIEMIIEKNII